MNYWPALPCNLSECQEPLFDFISSLSVNGAKTAKVSQLLQISECLQFCTLYNSEKTSILFLFSTKLTLFNLYIREIHNVLTV